MTIKPSTDIVERPVYWAVWILDEETKTPRHWRNTSRRYTDPQNALDECYGRGMRLRPIKLTSGHVVPANNVLTFNLSSTLDGLRKLQKPMRALWAEMGGKA